MKNVFGFFTPPRSRSRTPLEAPGAPCADRGVKRSSDSEDARPSVRRRLDFSDAETVGNGWFSFGRDSKFDRRVESLERGIAEAERKLERLVELDDEISKKCKGIDADVRDLTDETLALSRRADASLAKLAELRERFGSSADTMPPPLPVHVTHEIARCVGMLGADACAVDGDAPAP